MQLDVLFIEECPSWETAHARLLDALQILGEQAEVCLTQVDSVDESQWQGFAGSPTLLADGSDLFPTQVRPRELTCRLYATPSGLAGSPTVEQLVTALRQVPLERNLA